MAMLSPFGRVPKRRPLGRNPHRRAWPFVVFMVALIALAGALWWAIFHPHLGETRAAAACSPTTGPFHGLKAAQVRVRVYNAANRAGLAQEVADRLKALGFTIEAVSNDPLRRSVKGVGEIRFGELGATQADVLAGIFPGAKLLPDTRTDSIVDVALGHTFTRITPPSSSPPSPSSSRQPAHC